MRPLEIAIIAADPLARTGLAAVLDGEATFNVTYRWPALTDCFDDDIAPTTAVIVWDLGWDEPDLADDLDQLPAPILALVPDGENVPELWRAGVRGIVPRDAEVERLTAAIGALAVGLQVGDPQVVAEFPALLIGNSGELPNADIDALTPRENEVLQELAEGLTNRAIAQRLAISDHTVKFHVNAIMTKLHAQSRTDAVVRATRAGLLSL